MTEARDFELSDRDLALLGDEATPAERMAMRILVRVGRATGARRLLDISSAHIDGCLYHGLSGVHFAEKLLTGGAQVRVPTTLNVGGLDQLNPDNFKGDAEQRRRAGRMMECYEAMGCKPTWTCAPYQGVHGQSAAHRPALGEQIAWAESNAIVFANSVLGARTERYGDFVDICAAITGRAPAVGLHLDEGRRARLIVDVRGLPPRLLASDVLYPVLGYWLGERCQGVVPVIVGLPRDTDEDRLKALGAAAASSGSLALFHAVGLTPEAPTLEAALRSPGAREVAPPETLTVTVEDMLRSRDRLSTVPDGEVDVVALGSPHFSIEEFGGLLPLVEEQQPSPGVELVACTQRHVLWALEARGWRERLEACGVKLVADTCVVVAPILETTRGNLMTNSGKFAHYTPGNLGLGVIYGSLEECVASAACGQVVRDREIWGGR